jgi:DNA-binding NtrC family response regulator
MLKKLGYNIISAGSGAEAVKVFTEKTEEIDAVILDMVMPEMSGGETFTRLKKIKPDVKVLLASGYSVSEEALRILNDGQGGFIQKPFDIQKVSSKIREILDIPKPGSVSKSLPFCLSGQALEYDFGQNQNPD